jgi:hypothetical protein
MASDDAIAGQLREIFADRLRMVAAFGADSHICAVVESVGVDDLDKCAKFFGSAVGWKNAGLGAPLLLTVDDLARALDAFPLEFNEIITTRRVIAGADLLAALHVPAEHVRRACEVQARSHLLHLREGYIEAAGNPKAVSALVAASHSPFRALLSNVARLDGISPGELTNRLGLKADGFADALGAAERLVEHVDRWHRT